VLDLRLQADLREGASMKDGSTKSPLPSEAAETQYTQPNMALRDYFAAHAPPMPEDRKPRSPTSEEDLARWAYNYADAMIRRRGK